MSIYEQEENALAMFTYQSVEGLKLGETVFIFTEEQLEDIKEKSNVPFYYATTADGYVLFPSSCEVVNDRGEVEIKDYCPRAIKYCKKYMGVRALTVRIADTDNDVTHYCFEGYRNYEEDNDE